MGNMGSVKVYRWKYDDGAFGFAARLQSENGTRKWIDYGYCANKNKFQKMTKGLKDKYASCNVKKCWIPGGLDSLHPSDFRKPKPAKAAKGIEAVKCLLCSCGTDVSARKTLLNLVSAILSGYCARFCHKFYKVDYVAEAGMRAPIISVKFADYSYEVLKKIVLAFAVETSISHSEDYAFSQKPLHTTYYPVLPRETSENSILDSVYLKLPMFPNKLMPQYRDTTILIHCGFIPSKEIIDFQKRNPWVSVVLFDASAKKTLSTPVQINGAIIAKSDCSWDSDAISYVAEQYVSYLSRMVHMKQWGDRISRYFQEIEKMIFQYNTSAKNEPVKRAQKYQISLQMLALRLFLSACKADNGISKEEASALLAEWYNTLLPGCCEESAEPESDIAADNHYVQEPDAQQIFEDILCRMLREENRAHFLFVPKGEKYDRADPDDPKCQYWGYLRMFSPENNRAKEFPALCFRQKDFEEAALTSSPALSVKELIKSLRKEPPDYLYGVDKGRFPTGAEEDKRPVPAITINIGKMSFLSKDQMTYIGGYFPNDTLQIPPEAQN